MPSGAVDLRSFLAAGARALVDAQLALDADAGDDTPAGFAYTRCRIGAPVAAACEARASFAGHSTLALAPRPEALAGLRVGIRLVARPPEGRDEAR